MDDAASMEDRHSAILAELAGLGVALARDLQARALAAQDAAEASRLAEAFHKVSRGVRQTLALEAKLRRDAARGAQETADRAARDARRLREAHAGRVRARVERLVWTEYERDDAEAEELVDTLAELVDEAALDDGFTATPAEVLARRIAGELGLHLPANDAPAQDAGPFEAGVHSSA